MYTPGKGISKSARPYRRTPPSWLKLTGKDVSDKICKLAKKGLTPSKIGVILRDQHGVGQICHVTGSKVLRILRANGAYASDDKKKKKLRNFRSFVVFGSSHRAAAPVGLAAAVPEDLYMLIKKAVSMRKHLERNRKDLDSKYRLITVESRIHRLARYYKQAG